MNIPSIKRYTAESSGTRTDKFVSERYPEYSRTFIQKSITGGLIRVNGNIVKPGRKLEAGDLVSVNIQPVHNNELISEEIPLKIVYENDDLLVVDKPAGLTTHPSPGQTTHTLINALLAYYPRLRDMGNTFRPGIVHRLDKNTSGLIIIAKNTRSQLNLIEQFKNRSIEKTYITLVKGHITPERGIIEAPIGRSPANRKRMAVVASGRPAHSQYRVIRYIKEYTLLEVKPETGRTHQIRVHLGAIGYPVVGDETYGVKSPFIKRQFLHAYKLRFKLPSSGEEVELKSDLPEDLEAVLKNIG